MKLLKSFIETKLPKLLSLDLQNLLIIKEADIECCAYFHLRKFLGERKSWKILARKHVSYKKSINFVDILIFEREKPRIAIELKWGKTDIGEKDRKSLITARKELRVDKAYWISALPPKKYVPPQQEDNIHKIIVTLNLTDKKLEKEKWKKDRANYMKEMSPGDGQAAADEGSVAIF